MESTLAFNPPPYCQPGLGERGPALVGIRAVMTAIFVPVVLLRLYGRKYIINALWWDDFAMAFAASLLLPVMGLAWYSASLGTGHHIECVRPETVFRIIEIEFIAQVLVIFVMTSARISVALLVTRVFATSLTAKIWLYALMIFMTLVMVITACISIPICDPVEKQWNPTVPGTCWSTAAKLSIQYINGSVSTFSDLVLALAPAYFIWGLQMKPKIKLGVLVLTGLGLVTAALAMARTIQYSKVTEPDVTWNVAEVTIFVNLEATIAIIAGSIPTLRPVFQRDRKLSSYQKRTFRLDEYKEQKDYSDVPHLSATP